MVKARLRHAAALTLLIPAAGCASSYLPVDANGARTASPPASLAPGVVKTPEAKSHDVSKVEQKADSCGAAALAYMVGRPRAELPVPVDLSRRRVVCSTCAVSGPSQSDRQTILYDSASQRIVAVTCG